MRKISDLPRISKGAELTQYLGKFVLIRAKLVTVQYGGKRSKFLISYKLFN